MTAEDLNTRLYEKMYAEQKAFVAEFKNTSSENFLTKAYELVIREDLLFFFEENNLPPKECKALLREKKPLAKLFNAWDHHESGHMDEIGDCVEHFASELVKQGKKRQHSECR